MAELLCRYSIRAGKLVYRFYVYTAPFIPKNPQEFYGLKWVNELPTRFTSPAIMWILSGVELCGLTPHNTKQLVGTRNELYIQMTFCLHRLPLQLTYPMRHLARTEVWNAASPVPNAKGPLIPKLVRILALYLTWKTSPTAAYKSLNICWGVAYFSTVSYCLHSTPLLTYSL